MVLIEICTIFGFMDFAKRTYTKPGSRISKVNTWIVLTRKIQSHIGFFRPQWNPAIWLSVRSLRTVPKRTEIQAWQSDHVEGMGNPIFLCISKVNTWIVLTNKLQSYIGFPRPLRFLAVSLGSVYFPDSTDHIVIVVIIIITTTPLRPS